MKKKKDKFMKKIKNFKLNLKFKNKFYYDFTFLTLIVFIIEMIFKMVSNQNIFDVSSMRILMGLICINLVISYIESFFKDKYTKVINLIIIIILTIYSLLQVGFNNFLGVYISFNVSSQAGAVASYIFDFIKSFYWYYYFLLFPLILVIIYYILRKKEIINLKFEDNLYKSKNLFTSLILILIFTFLYDVSISVEAFQNKLQTITNKELFNNPSNPSIAIKQFGTTMYMLLDIKNVILGVEPETIEVTTHYNQDPSLKIDDSKWLSLIETEENGVLNNLNDYFINNKYTGENSYTGLFEDKNLIVIMMESTNDIFINEELYPNFYKLLSTGYYFENNYSPRNSCATGNNELSGMIGLYSIYNKCTANAYKDNLYPESIFNLFNNKGYKTMSMHDYTERYYARRDIHTNMGSMHYFDVDDLGLTYNTWTEEWASDEEFMGQVVKILNNYGPNDKFMTWLTTVTPHQPYGKSEFGDKYLELFDDPKYDNYNIKLKRYMSKLKIEDDGLGVLLKGLEKQGKLDDTVIVLYGDHYPYGLSNNILKEALPYVGSEKYENERVPFVIWSNDLEPRTFEQYTSYVNVVPTIANLFNLNYDSRYYTGSDLFSNDYEGLVIFADGSWKNKYAFYDASNSNITYYTYKEYTVDDLIKINKIVEDKIKYSNLAIQHDYFNYLDKALKN